MIKHSIALFTCLTLLTLPGSSQTSTDTLTCLTPRQVKIANLIVNELDRMQDVKIITDSIIGTKDARILVLNSIVQLRTDQVTGLNLEAFEREKQIKKLNRQILLWRIATLTGIIVTGLILK